VWLERRSREAGRRITLADIDDATIDAFAEQGFDGIWLLSESRANAISARGCPLKCAQVRA
jgi:hypothetical protein